MLIKFEKKVIATLLKDTHVQKGIEKASKNIALPDMSITDHVLEYVGAAILHNLSDPNR